MPGQYAQTRSVSDHLMAIVLPDPGTCIMSNISKKKVSSGNKRSPPFRSPPVRQKDPLKQISPEGLLLEFFSNFPSM